MKRARDGSERGRVPKRARTQEAQVAAVVKREMGKKMDLLYCDASSYGAVDSSGTITSCLVNLARGDDGINNHNGNVLRPKGLSVNFYSYSPNSYNAVRFMVIQWLDNTTPTATDILQSTTTGVGVISPPNVNSKGRMKVLADKQYILAATAGGDNTITGYGVISEKLYIPGNKMKSIKVRTGSNDIIEGHLYIFVISDDSLIPYPGTYWYSRLSFYD